MDYSVEDSAVEDSTEPDFPDEVIEANTVAFYDFPSETTVSDLLENTTEDTLTECEEADEFMDYFTWIWFGYSLLVIILLGFIVRRKALCLSRCRGRPGFAQPIDFIEETGRRWAYGACFVIISFDIIWLFMGQPFWHILHTEDKAWMKKFGWVKVFTKLLDALSTCLVHYPLLACIDHRTSIVANIFGSIHVIPWIVLYARLLHACPLNQEADHGINLLLFRVPVFVSYFIVGFSYVLDFALNVHKWRKQRAAKIQTNKSEIFGESRKNQIGHHFEYIINMLRKRDLEEIEKGKGLKVILKKTIDRVKYDKIFGFRYSSRLICCVTICTTVLLWFVVFAITLIDSVLDSASDICKWFEDASGNINFITDICKGFRVVKILAHFSSALSAFLIFLMLVNTLITYKRRWHQLLRGDHSWHGFGETINTPSNTLLSGLKFAGFQVAFVIWGWVVLTAFLFIIFMFATFAFIIPLRDGVKNWLIQKLIDLWPTLLLGIIIIPLTQKLICRFVFLQHRGSVMALTNRRIYNAASYYFLVLNIIVGIFSCLKRILIPLVLGIAFLSRLDQPLIMKGYESKDPGYVAFVSMLLVDLYHNHPVVKAFVELLNHVRQNQKPTADYETIELQRKIRHSKRMKNKWWKIVTLANNPCLALKALEERLIADRDQRGNLVSQEAIKIEDALKSDTDSVKKIGIENAYC